MRLVARDCHHIVRGDPLALNFCSFVSFFIKSQDTAADCLMTSVVIKHHEDMLAGIASLIFCAAFVENNATLLKVNSNIATPMRSAHAHIGILLNVPSILFSAIPSTSTPQSCSILRMRLGVSAIAVQGPFDLFDGLLSSTCPGTRYESSAA